MTLILRYFTEIVYRRKKFTFAVSSSGEFLVNNNRTTELAVLGAHNGKLCL